MPYEAAYPEGTMAKVAPRQDLEKFHETWRFHHPLQPSQLQYADRTAPINWVGYDHGGDVMYQLEGIPGIWHECCLRPTTVAEARAGK